MNAATLMTARDQVIKRVGDAGPLTIEAGERFERNLWFRMSLPHLNVSAVAELVRDLREEGILAMTEGTMTRRMVGGGGATESPYRSSTRERVYALTERGRIEYNKIIAATLEISPRTVEIYRANVMSKMRAESLSDLIRSTITAGAA